MVARNKVVAALVVTAATFAGTAAMYQQSRDIVVDFENAYEGGIISEFHNRERIDEQFFRWTKAVSFLDFHNVPTTGELAVEARLRVRRPHGEPLPNLAFTANGATVHTTPGLPGAVSYRFAFPASDSHVRLAIRSDTFDPSGERPLGVQVLGVNVELPDAPMSWVAPSLVMAAAAGFLFAGAIVAGGGVVSSGAASLVASGAFVYLLSQHALRFSLYPWHVATLAALTLVVVLVVQKLQKDPRPAVTSAIAALFLIEMSVAMYPLTVSSDAHFQANRMRHFIEGNWHPESVTQHEPPFRIPYPVSLFAMSSPWLVVGLERVTALTLTTSLFDVLVSVLLMWLGWRFFDDIRGGVIAGVLYQAVPMNALSFSAGNFTNIFAVSMLALAFTFLLTRPVASAVAATLALCAHFGMFIEGLVLFPLWLVYLWLAPTPANDERKRLSVAFGVSFAIVLIYYAGYAELVTSQWDSVMSNRSGAGTGGWRATVAGLTWVFVAVAALGSITLWKSRAHHPSFRGIALTWLAVTAAFFAVDLVSAVEIRYAFQALPLLALVGGIYLSQSLERSRMGGAAAWAAILYISWMGVNTLHDVALIRYH